MNTVYGSNTPLPPSSSLSYLFADSLGSWHSFLQQIDKVVPYMGKTAYWIEALKRPKRSLIVDVPIEMDNGTIAHFEGYRVQHNTSRGPAKGGIRFHPNATLAETMAHAGWMTIKHAVANLPFGGAQGSVRVDRNSLSCHELEKLTRRYTTEVSILIGPNKDIITPDLNTDAKIMAWMMDTYSFMHGGDAFDTVMGKPCALGGTRISKDAAGRGLFFIAIDAARRMGMAMGSVRIAVQGFGRVGSSVARLFHKAGAQIIAIQDLSGSIYNSAGIDIPALQTHVDEKGAIKGFFGAQEISQEDFWRVDAQMLVPAAMENQITEKNAPDICAKLIIEAANGPTTQTADQILEEKGTIIIPDVLANIGGATVNYFEWVQNFSSVLWSEEETNERLSRIMRDAFASVWQVFEEHNISMRTAAFILACSRILDARSQRGVFP